MGVVRGYPSSVTGIQEPGIGMSRNVRPDPVSAVAVAGKSRSAIPAAA